MPSSTTRGTWGPVLMDGETFRAGIFSAEEDYMAQPVWILSVDLQTKTATFQSGLADAARSARSAFTEINSGAAEMGQSVSRGSLDVRHALGLVDNTIRGAHSMAMVDLIRMFQNSAIVMQGLPFAMVVAGIGLVGEIAYKAAEKINEMRMAEEKLRNSQTQLSTGIQDTFNHLADKLLEAQKRVDELNGNHLAALHKELILIDHTSLEELRHSFDSVAKEAEGFFGQLKAHWYELGIGSEGAQHALEQFKLQYNSLLAQGNTEKASGLLQGTLDQAKLTLELQQRARAYKGFSGTPTDSEWAAELQFEKDKAQLKKIGAGDSDKEIAAQQALVQALQAQKDIEAGIAAIKAADDNGAKLSTHKESNRDASKRIAEEQRAMREFTANVRQDEDDQIEATQAGSSERLAAIRRAMEETRELFGEESHIYRHYADEETQTMIETGRQLQEIARQMDAEAAREKQEAAKEAAANDQKMGELRIAAEKQEMALSNSGRRVSDEERIAQETKIANEEYALKMAALQEETAGLDASGKDYQNKLRQLQNQEKQLTQAHENEITAIKEKAETARNARILASFTQAQDTMARGLTQSIMGHQTWSRMVLSLGDQVVSGMVQNAIKSMLADDMTKERDAAAAGRKAFLWGWENGGPAAPVLAPIMAAGAFAAVMAFETGTDRVPGIGKGDVVPAMLSPGEGVVPGGVMDGLRTIARNGGFNQRPTQHVQVHYNPQVHAMDAEGVARVLDKHGEQFQRHFEGVLRRMNH